MSVLDELRAWFDARAQTVTAHDNLIVEASALYALLDVSEAAQRLETVFTGLAQDANDGTYALFTEAEMYQAANELHAAFARLDKVERAA